MFKEHLVFIPMHELNEDVDPVAPDVDLVVPYVVMDIPLRRSDVTPLPPTSSSEGTSHIIENY